MTIAQSIARDFSHTPDLTAVRADMESTRQAYHQLLNSLTDAEWQQPAAVSKWTVKEIMCHLVLGVETAVPMMVKQARKRQPMPSWLNSGFGNWLNYKMAVWGARKATRQSLAERYDAAQTALLKLLAEVQAQEWGLPTAYPDGTPLTMETVFHVPTEHFELHSAWIRQTLNRR